MSLRRIPPHSSVSASECAGMENPGSHPLDGTVFAVDPVYPHCGGSNFSSLEDFVLVLSAGDGIGSFVSFYPAMCAYRCFMPYYASAGAVLLREAARCMKYTCRIDESVKRMEVTGDA